MAVRGAGAAAGDVVIGVLSGRSFDDSKEFVAASLTRQVFSSIEM
jgi:hypothetical protein